MDYSLNAFLTHLYLRPIEGISIFLNGEKIEMQNYWEVLKK